MAFSIRSVQDHQLGLPVRKLCVLHGHGGTSWGVDKSVFQYTGLLLT
ncbi:hypothetical protein BN871_DF_00500 [Paenibacillus sp. P22]|nr:hypothetical protein BN871_DF_00500 [Paenibacillus sp. P22]